MVSGCTLFFVPPTIPWGIGRARVDPEQWRMTGRLGVYPAHGVTVGECPVEPHGSDREGPPSH
eukprot:1320243-Pleurochrysis_carterae.AAC.1